MGKKLSLFVALFAFFAACATMQRAEMVAVPSNTEATHRIDILPKGHGSAVVLTEDGYLLTCHHVAFTPEGKPREMVMNIAVDGATPKAFPIRIIAWDAAHDLAVVKVERRFERTVILGDIHDVQVLDRVYNVGFPYDIGEVGSVGYVKALHVVNESYGLDDALLLVISDGPGTSGSGIFLAKNGRLIGIMHALIAMGPHDGRQVVIRIVIPIDVIRKFLDRAKIPYRAALSFLLYCRHENQF